MDKKDFYVFEIKSKMMWKIIGTFIVLALLPFWLIFLYLTIGAMQEKWWYGIFFGSWFWWFFCIDIRMADLSYSRIKVDKRNRTIEIRRLFRLKKVILVDKIKRWRRVRVNNRSGYPNENIYLYYGNSKFLISEVYIKDYVRFSSFMQQYAGNKCVSRTYFQNILDDMGYFLTIN
ncbi:MAG: hypothetical protein K6A61_09540 [Butyrivibrio sp.]|nr:hypothetical protein [Butyrivibrio hungatei]MCR4997526.1 hypothetical protein [Butyrivibrio sp.]